MFVLFTPPNLIASQAKYYNTLFAYGLHVLVVRLKDATRSHYERVLLAIEPQYRTRVIVDDYYELINLFNLGGAYLNATKRCYYDKITDLTDRIVTSAHSLDELATLPFTPTFAFLSPVYDSISKKGYKANVSFGECKIVLPTLPFPVVALGGITPNNARDLLNYGFAGIAVLGYLSTFDETLLPKFLQFPQTRVLTVAGHDPSSGAGFVADALHMQAMQVYPLTIPSVLTIQHEEKFEGLLPIRNKVALQRMATLLLKQHPVSVAKLGLTENLVDVLWWVNLLKQCGVGFIVWDPIVKPTKANAELVQYNGNIFKTIAKKVTLITPNAEEAQQLLGTNNPDELLPLAKELGCNILVTGVFNNDFVEDVLLTLNGEMFSFPTPRSGTEKHGTGCALSTAIATRMAQGYSIAKACKMGQCFVSNMRKSSYNTLEDYRYSSNELKYYKLGSVYLQYITNGNTCQEILASVKAYIEGGGRWVQLRMKQASKCELIETGKKVKALIDSYNNPQIVFIINDSVEVALACNADGVHLGLTDSSVAEARNILGEAKIIGGTCNTVDDIYRRMCEGVDYVGVGPFRNTQTKKNLSTILGEEGLVTLVKERNNYPFRFPMVAIGGITGKDIDVITATGVDGVAISGALEQTFGNTNATAMLIEKVKHAWCK